MEVSIPFPEPTTPVASRAEVFLGYLDYFRSRLVSKLEGLPAAELRRSRLPSGWTPLELLKHLTHVEMRWLECGFEGRDVPDPWADSRDGRWYVAPEETLTGLVTGLRAQAARTRIIAASHDLADVGQPGERWDGADPPPLERILFHLLQEYARHVGHLDIASELAGCQGQVREAGRSALASAERHALPLKLFLEQPERLRAHAMQLPELRSRNTRKLLHVRIPSCGQRPGGGGADVPRKAAIR